MSINLKQELFLFGVMILALSAWAFSYLWEYSFAMGLGIFGLIIIVLSFLTKKMEYTIPFMLNMVYIMSTNFNTNTNLIPMIIGLILMILGLISFLYHNHIKLSMGKHGIGFIIIIVVAIISCFNSPYFPSYPVFATLGCVLYFFVYLIYYSSIKGNIIIFFCNIMTYIGLLITFELVLGTLMIPNWWQNIMNLEQKLGWGVSNDGAIVILTCAPFAFYKFYKEDFFNYKALDIVKIFLLVFGVFISFARAAMLIGFPMFGILGIYVAVKLQMFKLRPMRILLYIFSGLFVLTITVLLIENTFLTGFINMWSDEGLGDAGRFSLYQKAIDNFKMHPLFGNSMVVEFDVNQRFVVYHSTFFQTLSMLGIFGVIGLIVHFIFKYKMIVKKNCPFCIIMLIGFISIDLYGLVDNTYHMITFMGLLAVSLAIIERGIDSEIEDDLTKNEIKTLQME